jgi:hypothetical protein
MCELCSTSESYDALTDEQEASLRELYDWTVASDKGLKDFFRKHPQYKDHNQGNWGEVLKNGHCKTAFCLAGQKAIVEGYTFVLDADDLTDTYMGERFAASSQMVRTADVHSLGMRFVKGAGKTFARPVNAQAQADLYRTVQTEHPATIAQDSLGITNGEADRLFNGSNEVNDIREIINLIFERRGLEPIED